jgi:glucose-6-phosphate 1-dehydrogenase
MRGDASQFTSDACVEAAWAVVDPVLDNAEPVHEYAPGSWGPAAAKALTADDGGWHDPKVE